MKWEIINTRISLADPESGFTFASRKSNVILYYRDWQNNPVSITFFDVAKFSYSWLPPYNEVPEETFLRRDAPKESKVHRESNLTTKAEPLVNYLISTNEGEWCEFLATSYSIKLTVKK